MNQIVRDLGFHISPEGYDEPNRESQVNDYLVLDTRGD
jgi:hypothetical protein